MTQPDTRRVVLIKSLATGNRFYALVPPELGIRNADTVETIPDDILLGIAYPCLEDGLNDFAVIRTTFETLEFFPDDEEMRGELMAIVDDARSKLIKRLKELRDRIGSRQALFLGTDLEEFRSYAMDIIRRGYPRRNLDSMMKLNVFGSVANAEGHSDGSEPLYYYEFRDPDFLKDLMQATPWKFIAGLFADVLDSVLDDTNYASRYTFDRNVFQKFIAVMFVNYATTDPQFYGTNRDDYGVSEDKEMDETPLYRAIALELRRIEADITGAGGFEIIEREAETTSILDATIHLPDTIVNEEALIGPIAAICAAANHLARNDDSETAQFGQVLLLEASKLVSELKKLGIVSPSAYDPGAGHELGDAD
jgi:hypothetical protein